MCFHLILLIQLTRASPPEARQLDPLYTIISTYPQSVPELNIFQKRQRSIEGKIDPLENGTLLNHRAQ